MYRLTPTSVEIIGVRVPRSRTDFFQDDIFMPTHDVETPALSASAWLAGENKELARVDLRPANMILRTLILRFSVRRFGYIMNGWSLVVWKVWNTQVDYSLSQAPAPVVTRKKVVVRETTESNEANLNQQGEDDHDHNTWVA
ncbi:hypothetical protein BC937DRAFT_89067 [Endogone sp. FLAS-F59071]|nr:hypothetical protein BC937DRAFT_89067 [Endogone sp. FLAS-F59071]|eukprot:RUS18182.1 hypothetical protein BC937DRAFT_89067 [Endogone sp. FLAS-F59071]